MKNLTFKNGDIIPALGLGTWKSDPGEVYEAVLKAIKMGYRHIDCAYIYGNEKEIGDAIQKAISENIVSRKELFITSKLWNNSHKKEDVKSALKKTLADLQLDFLDLYLIHWPVAQKPEAEQPTNESDFLNPQQAPLVETWKEMIKMREEGLTRHIGVANFSIHHLESLGSASDVRPEMNQVEMHPCLSQEKLVSFCKKHDIHVTAYSPLGSRDRSDKMKKDDEPDLFELESVKKAASKHDKSSAEILIAWAIKQGVAVIPKSTSEDHMKSNLEAVKIQLGDDEADAISAENKDYRFVDGSFWTKEGSPYSMEYLWG